MLTTRFCKECGSKNSIDDSKEKFFCSFCGAANIIDKADSKSPNSSDSPLSTQNEVIDNPSIKPESGSVSSGTQELIENNHPVTNTVAGFAPPPPITPNTIASNPQNTGNVAGVAPIPVTIPGVIDTNVPNLYVDYKTTNNNVRMQIEILCLGKTFDFNNEDFIQIYVPEGRQVIKFKIGTQTYIRTVTIQKGVVIHIYCSWNRSATIDTDIPACMHVGNYYVQQEILAKQKSGTSTGTIVAGILLGVLLTFIIVPSICIASNRSSRKSSNQQAVAEGSALAGNDQQSNSATEMNRDSFIESCSELDYKALARNPDNYIGQNYYFVCYVSSVRTGGLTSGYQKYCVTYAFDIDEARERVENGYSESLEEAAIFCTDYDTCVWLVDNRDESDSDYTKILDNDIAIVYGTFTGLTTSKNSLTNETSEKVSLDIKYVDIIEE